MSDEEKEALEWLENDVKKSKELRDKWHMYMASNKNEVLLNLIKKQNRAIDRMAEELSKSNGTLLDYEDICKGCKGNSEDCHGDFCEERIKQYFLNKQEKN